MGLAWTTSLTLIRWRVTTTKLMGYPAASDVRAFIMSYIEDWTPEDMYCGDEYVGPSKYGTAVKRCRMCDSEVEMSTDHGVCGSCASAMERGQEW
jgi:hypothetical protein